MRYDDHVPTDLGHCQLCGSYIYQYMSFQKFACASFQLSPMSRSSHFAATSMSASPDSRGTRNSSVTWGTSFASSFDMSTWAKEHPQDAYNPISKRAYYFAAKAKRSARYKRMGQSSHSVDGSSCCSTSKADKLNVEHAKEDDYSLEYDPLLISFAVESPDPTVLSDQKGKANRSFLQCGGVELHSVKKHLSLVSAPEALSESSIHSVLQPRFQKRSDPNLFED
jgi:hypothetical protein